MWRRVSKSGTAKATMRAFAAEVVAGLAGFESLRIVPDGFA
jgi:hypothetical protein